MRVHTVTSSARTGYSISRQHLEVARTTSDLGDAAIPLLWSGVINRKGYWSPTCDDKKMTVARDVGGRRRERRKEVALGRLITVSLILILGAWGGTVEGAGPDDTAAAPSSATRQPPPAPPIKYLEAGARLFNSAENGVWSAQLDLASKYLQAADTYREQLQPDEQATLDAYLKELAKARSALASRAASPSATPEVPTGRPVSPAAPVGVRPVVATAANPAIADQNPASADTRQRGRWLLHEAREQLHLGNYDTAQQKVDEAEALDVKWGLFDDTPAKVTEEIKKLRPRIVTPTGGTAAYQSHDRRTARSKLHEARAALANRQFEQAEAIALDVKKWGLSYGFLEDNPDKVASAARALRRRDKLRNTPSREQSSQGVYDILVQESRQLISIGKLDEAEAKARMAQRMNVVPPLTADRAESVLHEIAMARAQKAPATIASRSAPEAPVLKMEREANALLAKGDHDAAAAKFSEADRIATGESPAAITAAVATNRTSDPEVRQIAATDPNPAPDLAAPVDNAAAAQQPAPAIEVPATSPTASAPAPSRACRRGYAGSSAALPPGQTAGNAAANRGEVLLSEAKELYKNANYRASKQIANAAKAGKFGVDAQADELLAQIALAEQAGALSLYEEALAALRGGDNTRARSRLAEVAAAGDSLDEGLRAKVDNLLQKLSADEKAKTAVNSRTNTAQDAEALAAQKLNAEVGTKIAEGRRLHETDPDKAIAIYQKAVQAVQASGLSPDLSRPMIRRLEVAIELATKDKVAFTAKMQDKQLRAEIELKRLRILEADGAKKRRMKDLMDKATSAYAEGKYDECETFAKRAMEVDPNELAASMLVYKAKTERRFKQDLQNKNDKEEGVVTAFQGVDMAAIANPEVQLRDISYAKDFKDLTKSRLAMNARLEPRKDPKVMAIEAKLSDRISINMDKQPLSEAVTFLTNYTGLNIILDPKAVADAGLSSASPVTLTLNNSKLKTVLKLLLQPLGLTYKLEDDVIVITSPEAMQAQTITQTYYVGDLVMPPDHAPQNLLPDKIFNREQNPSNDPNAGFGPNPGTFGPTDPRYPHGFNATGNATGERPKIDMTPIIQLITTSIAPGTWKVQDGYGQEGSAAYGLGGGFGGDAGGGLDQQRQPGAIVPFFLSISLIIKHTAEVHDQVADLLRQLRRLQDLQVSVEVRFITVNDTFFEFIGVDFDFQIQSDTVGKHSTFAIPNPANAIFAASGLDDEHEHEHFDLDERRYGTWRHHGRRRHYRRRWHHRRRRGRNDRRRRLAERPAVVLAERPAAVRRTRPAASAGGGSTVAPQQHTDHIHRESKPRSRPARQPASDRGHPGWRAQ